MMMLLLFALLMVVSVYAKIRDPMNFFCGEHNCYDVLEVDATIDTKKVKSAYRRAAVKYHPDKNRAKNATVVFQLVEKAYKVLSDQEKRDLFDYYLAHPRAYYKVTGHFIYNMPKMNVGVLVAGVVVLLSMLSHYRQLHNHESIKKKLQTFVLKEGGKGNSQTEELYVQATERFEKLFKASMAAKNLKKVNVPGRRQMMADPIFAQAVEEVVNEVEFEGGARKPRMEDLFAYRLVRYPYTMYVSWSQYYLIEVQGKEPSEEVKEEVAMQRMGAGTWHSLQEKERAQLLKDGIYKAAVFNAWYVERERAAEVARQVVIEKKRRKMKQMGYESDEYEWVEDE